MYKWINSANETIRAWQNIAKCFNAHSLKKEVSYLFLPNQK